MRYGQPPARSAGHMDNSSFTTAAPRFWNRDIGTCTYYKHNTACIRGVQYTYVSVAVLACLQRSLATVGVNAQSTRQSGLCCLHSNRRALATSNRHAKHMRPQSVHATHKLRPRSACRYPQVGSDCAYTQPHVLCTHFTAGGAPRVRAPSGQSYLYARPALLGLSMAEQTALCMQAAGSASREPLQSQA